MTGSTCTAWYTLAVRRP